MGEIVVAAPPGEEDRVRREGIEVVSGGPSRSESVAVALKGVEADVVVVHDAARPLVTPELNNAVVGALLKDEGAGAVVAASPVTDTIKQVGQGKRSLGTLDRWSLWAAQTPQAFRVLKRCARRWIRPSCWRRRPTTRCWSSGSAAECCCTRLRRRTSR